MHYLKFMKKWVEAGILDPLLPPDPGIKKRESQKIKRRAVGSFQKKDFLKSVRISTLKLTSHYC